MGTIFELIYIQKWTDFVIENIDTLVTNSKDGKSLINSHQADIWTQNNARMSIFFMPENWNNLIKEIVVHLTHYKYEVFCFPSYEKTFTYFSRKCRIFGPSSSYILALNITRITWADRSYSLNIHCLSILNPLKKEYPNNTLEIVLTHL